MTNSPIELTAKEQEYIHYHVAQHIDRAPTPQQGMATLPALMEALIEELARRREAGLV